MRISLNLAYVLHVDELEHSSFNLYLLEYINYRNVNENKFKN